MNRRLVALAVVAIAGCTLYSDVTIVPLSVQPANIDHPNDLNTMIRKADLVRAVQLAPTIEAKQNRSAQELAALGNAEMIAGRYDAARRHLRAAIELRPFRTVLSTICWDLSQIEYMTNNFEASLYWAQIAAEHGMVIKKWHTDYITALSGVNVYQVSGRRVERVSMRASRPDVPRIEVRLNKAKTVTGIIDSGAVTCIISEQLASELKVKRLGDFQGTFTGLLSEPIPVHFGLLESMEIGDMVISKVPIAIMADDKLMFFTTGKKEFRIDLLIGTNFLKEFKTELDYRRNQVTFTALTSADRHPSPDQNIFIEGFRPAVRGTINRHGWFMFILDTGSEVSFLNEKHIEDYPIQMLAPKIHSAMLQGLGGAEKHGPKVENVDLGFDKWAGVFHNLPMYDSAEADRTAGILGENYLRNFIVTIDFGRMRMDLAPINPFTQAPEVLVPTTKPEQ
ncbi:MAG TPA: aspartyl protease family protein [Thermoanaerobaculia bacterium]|nr:aspartyl protease family protein [Thermoanaerobaculia bacterium]